MALTDDYLDAKLYEAFLEARKGKTTTADEFKFDIYALENLQRLRMDIQMRVYKPSRSTAFICHEPVDREIFAAPFRDRVVHHFICGFIEDWWDRRLINSSYSCRKGKGSDEGIRDLYRKMRKVSQNFHRETVVVKIDLSSYFCSISRERLYQRVRWGLERQFLHEGHTRHERDLYNVLNYLSREVIFDNPVEGARIRCSVKEWEAYPKHKSLFHQRPGVGLVIGNLTSQTFSNVFLDEFDRFATITMGIKHYGRYVDDVFFVLPEAEKADFMRRKLPVLINFLHGMELKVNPRKTFCQNIRQGIPFLGAVVYPYHIVPSKRILQNLRRALRQVQAGERDPESVIAYLGRLQHFDAFRATRRIFAEFGLDYQPENKGVVGGKYFMG